MIDRRHFLKIAAAVATIPGMILSKIGNAQEVIFVKPNSVKFEDGPDWPLPPLKEGYDPVYVMNKSTAETLGFVVTQEEHQQIVNEISKLYIRRRKA